MKARSFFYLSDALEIVTMYAPSVAAMNDLFRQQYQLTNHFVNSMRRMHALIQVLLQNVKTEW